MSWIMYVNDESGVGLISCSLRILIGCWGSIKVLFSWECLKIFLICWLGSLRLFVWEWFYCERVFFRF